MPAPRGRVLTARNPEDLLAAVPVVLGFEPSDSVVMLTFGGTHTFHARVDLAPPDQLREMAAMLVEPAQRHRVPRVVLVLYTHDATAARRASRVLERELGAAGIDVLHTLRADGSRWYGPGAPASGVPYDLAVHAFRVDSVVQGVVTHASREQLAATLHTDALAAARIGGLPVREPFGADDVAGCVAHHLAHDSLLDDQEVLAAALGLRDVVVRDAAWAPMERESAAAHVLLWSDVVRRVPEELVGGPASVLAFAAWLAGNGALAWCAIDRATSADPANTLAELVGDLLGAAVPPVTWQETVRR